MLQTVEDKGLTQDYKLAIVQHSSSFETASPLRTRICMLIQTWIFDPAVEMLYLSVQIKGYERSSKISTTCSVNLRMNQGVLFKNLSSEVHWNLLSSSLFSQKRNTRSF